MESTDAIHTANRQRWEASAASWGEHADSRGLWRRCPTEPELVPPRTEVISGVRRVTTAHQTRTLDPTVPNHRRHVRLHVLDEKQRATAKRAAAVDELMAIIHAFLR